MQEKHIITVGSSSLDTLHCSGHRIPQDALGTTLGNGKKEERDDDNKLQPQPEFDDHPHHLAPLRLWNLDSALQRRHCVDFDDGQVLFPWDRLNACLGDSGPRSKRWPVR